MSVEFSLAEDAFKKVDIIKERINATTIASALIFLIFLGDTITKEILNGSNIIIEKKNGKTYKLSYPELE